MKKNFDLNYNKETGEMTKEELDRLMDEVINSQEDKTMKTTKTEKTKKTMNKIAAVAGITVIGLTDALVNGPIIRPITRLVQTGKLIVKTVKEGDENQVKEYVTDAVTNIIV